MSDAWKANVIISDLARYPYTLQGLAVGDFQLRAEVILAPVIRGGTTQRWVIRLAVRSAADPQWRPVTPGGGWNTDFWTVCWHHDLAYWFLAPATGNRATRPDEQWSERLWRALADHLADELNLDPEHPTLEPAWRRNRRDDDGDAPDLGVTGGAWQELEPRPRNPDEPEPLHERSLPGEDELGEDEIPF